MSADVFTSKQNLWLGNFKYFFSGPMDQGKASTMEPIGTVDFYPNGGDMMAGCEWSWWASACNHMKAVDYYVDSVNNRNDVNYLAATRCDSYEEFEAGTCDQMEKLPMGEALSLDMVNGQGPMKFYLHTNAVPPFGQ